MNAPRLDAWGPMPPLPVGSIAECPLCGEPIRPDLERTEDGAEWLGHCVSCNTIVEVL